MPKRVKRPIVNFGKRLAMFRRASGFTQQTFADAIDVSRRMIAYYEAETDYPPTALLPKMVQALNCSADTLLGIKTRASDRSGPLLIRFQRAERLSKKDQKAFLKVVDEFLGKVA